MHCTALVCTGHAEMYASVSRRLRYVRWFAKPAINSSLTRSTRLPHFPILSGEKEWTQRGAARFGNVLPVLHFECQKPKKKTSDPCLVPCLFFSSFPSLSFTRLQHPGHNTRQSPQTKLVHRIRSRRLMDYFARTACIEKRAEARWRKTPLVRACCEGW